MFWLMFQTPDMTAPTISHLEMEPAECFAMMQDYLQKIMEKNIQGHYEVGCNNIIDVPRTEEVTK